MEASFFCDAPFRFSSLFFRPIDSMKSAAERHGMVWYQSWDLYNNINMEKRICELVRMEGILSAHYACTPATRSSSRVESRKRPSISFYGSVMYDLPRVLKTHKMLMLEQSIIRPVGNWEDRTSVRTWTNVAAKSSVEPQSGEETKECTDPAESNVEKQRQTTPEVIRS